MFNNIIGEPTAQKKLILAVALVIILFLVNKYCNSHKINLLLRKNYIKLLIGLIIVAFIYYNTNVKYIVVVYGLLVIISLLTSNNEGFMDLFKKTSDTMIYNDYNTAYDNTNNIPSYEEVINKNNIYNIENDINDITEVKESLPMNLYNKTLSFFNVNGEIVEKNNIFDNRDLCEECEYKKDDTNNEEHQVLNRALDIDTPNPNSMYGKPHFVNEVEPI